MFVKLTRPNLVPEETETLQHKTGRLKLTFFGYGVVKGLDWIAYIDCQRSYMCTNTSRPSLFIVVVGKNVGTFDFTRE